MLTLRFRDYKFSRHRAAVAPHTMRQNVERYRRLLKTNLTENEREFVSAATRRRTTVCSTEVMRCRAKIVAADGKFQAAVKLGEAAGIITAHPVALQLRTLQTMAEISIEKNSIIIFPAQFMTTVQDAIALMSKDSASK